MGRPDVIVFDVNETLLDLRALRPGFESAMGSADAMGEWFARMLHGSLVANHVGAYRPFGEIGTDALVALADKRGVELSRESAAEVVAGMRTLPPHPDVIPALERLRDGGFRLVTLTNGSADAVASQLANSGVAPHIELAMSVDAVQRFKPAPDVYLTAAAQLGVDVDAMLMVAAHDWDIVGARSVGIPGAYIDRPSVRWAMPDRLPDLVGADLGDIADQLLG
ncbi:MAG TPA: haloacid dehalogenase type II [Acidimicrobiia bacterium]|jgi:2-haloacid dehalogenase|nr:haloacid dehalogenase type II [Acidimicrobiia bacterium]